MESCLLKESVTVPSSGVFGYPGSALTESRDLLRRSKLYSVLSSYGAAQTTVLEKIINIWRSVDLTRIPLRSQLQAGLAKIAKIDSSLKDAYSMDMDTYEDGALFIKRLIQDQSYLSRSLVVRSVGGFRGTLIVNYPKSTHSKGYVIKWVDRQEIDSTRIYQCISKYMPSIFSVPEFAAIDLREKTYGSIKGDVYLMEDSLFEELKRNYTDLTRLAVKPDEDSEDVEVTLEKGESLMLSEKIPGASAV